MQQTQDLVLNSQGEIIVDDHVPTDISQEGYAIQMVVSVSLGTGLGEGQTEPVPIISTFTITVL